MIPHPIKNDLGNMTVRGCKTIEFVKYVKTAHSPKSVICVYSVKRSNILELSQPLGKNQVDAPPKSVPLTKFQSILELGFDRILYFLRTVAKGYSYISIISRQASLMRPTVKTENLPTQYPPHFQSLSVRLKPSYSKQASLLSLNLTQQDKS